MEEDRSNIPSIVALCPKCKGWVQMCVDLSETKKEVKMVYSAAAKMGLNVERTNVAHCRTLAMCECS